ncbi:MAG: peptide chain release factor N(5)-glutamine methyltransferase [Candidatus Baltobacteraceae bacterium]
MNVRSALAAAGTEDASRLLAHVLGCERAWLVAHDANELSEADRKAFERNCARRKTGEPLAYIVGSAGFYRREFVVDRNVLVPRPETEHLIDEALLLMRDCVAPRMLDLGTGSGAIACTLAAELRSASVDAVDVSPQALDVARKNARRLNLDERIRFFLGDLLDPVRGCRYDCIVANLPYVPTGDIEPPPAAVGFEPLLALDGGADGLTLYRRLLLDVAGALAPAGWLLLEAAPPVMDALAVVVQTAFPNAVVRVGEDYGGRSRYLCTQP